MTPILADAHARSSVQDSLEQKGIEVLRVQDRLESDATDSQILDYAEKEDLVILTNDSDFENSRKNMTTPESYS